jgi:hypothetical protein
MIITKEHNTLDSSDNITIEIQLRFLFKDLFKEDTYLISILEDHINYKFLT